jgi:hypothetical protein
MSTNVAWQERCDRDDEARQAELDRAHAEQEDDRAYREELAAWIEDDARFERSQDV